MYRSHYNAVQVSLTQRTSHGLSFTAAYTYSHAPTMFPRISGPALPLNNTAPDASNYGNSDYDIRHRFTLKLTYALPGMKSPGQILQGWELNSIVTLQTATPWAVQDTSNDFSGTGEVNNPNTWGETWNFFGNPKDFTAASKRNSLFPGRSRHGCCYRSSLGTTRACDAKAAAWDALHQASLFNNGCYAVGQFCAAPSRLRNLRHRRQEYFP